MDWALAKFHSNQIILVLDFWVSKFDGFVHILLLFSPMMGNDQICSRLV